MNDRQENTFSMFLRVESRLDANLTIVSSVPALDTARLAFKSQIANIRATDLVATTTLTGIAQDKNNTKMVLIDACIQYAGSICAFAANNNNNTLYNEIYKSESDIKRLRDDQLPIYAQLLYDRLNTNLAALADFGINTGTLTNFNSIITYYNAVSQSPRSAMSTRKAAVADLKVQFKDVSNYLKKVIDKLVITLKPTHPFFVEEYLNDRNIYDDGGPSNTIQVYEGTLTPSQTSVVGAIPASTKDVRLEVLTSGTIEFGFTDNGVDFQGNTSTINGIGSSTPAITYFGTISAATQFMARNQNAINSVQYKVTFLR